METLLQCCCRGELLVIERAYFRTRLCKDRVDVELLGNVTAGTLTYWRRRVLAVNEAGGRAPSRRLHQFVLLLTCVHLTSDTAFRSLPTLYRQIIALPMPCFLHRCTPLVILAPSDLFFSESRSSWTLFLEVCLIHSRFLIHYSDGLLMLKKGELRGGFSNLVFGSTRRLGR